MPPAIFPEEGDFASGLTTGVSASTAMMVSSMDEFPPRFSVVIPVRNGENVIGACLKALAAQSVGAELYEVIVVNDKSTDETVSVVGDFAVKLVEGEGRGPAAARNLGAKQARGEILLFTDADCEPKPDWIEKLTEPLDDPEISGTRGLYDCKQPEWTARFAQLEYEQKYQILAKDEFVDFVDTSSAAYRKSVFDEFGGFCDEFGAAAAEDTDFSYQLARAGHKLVFCPDAFVFHQHPAQLSTYLSRKYKNAVWRSVLYNRHPGKMVRDSHTPQTLKIQILLLYAFAIAPAGMLLFSWPAWSLGLAPAAFLLTTVPFVLSLFRRDPLIALLSPGFLFLRSLAFAVGVPIGFVRLMLQKTGRRESF
ncbi:MAG: cellulose synthase/poly-beta-1,6-N-acetylglucosamine synthase-like glycosyltransferase [Verrucomicrobiales bacterium]|jgi:cellulose synthase/poly-beta-1,6-N-acetylglucosamine synthase-like glycosyltransferase